MEKEVKIKSVCKYNGHGVKPTKVVALSFRFKYDELPSSVQSLQMLNENVTIRVKLGDQPAMTVGTFMIKGLNFDGDGESVMNLGSQLDHIEPSIVNEIAAFGKDELFKIMIEARIEIEEPEESTDEWNDEDE